MFRIKIWIWVLILISSICISCTRGCVRANTKKINFKNTPNKKPNENFNFIDDFSNIIPNQQHEFNNNYDPKDFNYNILDSLNTRTNYKPDNTFSLKRFKQLR